MIYFTLHLNWKKCYIAFLNNIYYSQYWQHSLGLDPIWCLGIVIVLVTLNCAKDCTCHFYLTKNDPLPLVGKTGSPAPVMWSHLFVFPCQVGKRVIKFCLITKPGFSSDVRVLLCKILIFSPPLLNLLHLYWLRNEWYVKHKSYTTIVVLLSLDFCLPVSKWIRGVCSRQRYNTRAL